MAPGDKPATLGIDVGGTKVAAALVQRAIAYQSQKKLTEAERDFTDLIRKWPKAKKRAQPHGLGVPAGPSEATNAAKATACHDSAATMARSTPS